MPEPIVPADFDVPHELRGDGFWLEPLGPRHNERDHAAWMGSIEHIRSLPGFDGDWPQAMTLEKNLADLEMHERHFEDRVGFTYSVLSADEVIGCVYIYPAGTDSSRIEVRSWTTKATSDSHPLLVSALIAWMNEEWPFRDPVVVGA